MKNRTILFFGRDFLLVGRISPSSLFIDYLFDNEKISLKTKFRADENSTCLDCAPSIRSLSLEKFKLGPDRSFIELVDRGRCLEAFLHLIEKTRINLVERSDELAMSHHGQKQSDETNELINQLSPIVDRAEIVPDELDVNVLTATESKCPVDKIVFVRNVLIRQR